MHGNAVLVCEVNAHVPLHVGRQGRRLCDLRIEDRLYLGKAALRATARSVKRECVVCQWGERRSETTRLLDGQWRALVVGRLGKGAGVRQLRLWSRMVSHCGRRGVHTELAIQAPARYPSPRGGGRARRGRSDRDGEAWAAAPRPRQGTGWVRPSRGRTG